MRTIEPGCVAIVHPDASLCAVLKGHLQAHGYSVLLFADLPQPQALEACVVVLSHVQARWPDPIGTSPDAPLGEQLRQIMRPGGCALGLFANVGPSVFQQVRRESFDGLVCSNAEPALVAYQVETARKNRQRITDLEMRSRDARALLELSQKLASRLNQETILHETTLLVARTLEVDRCAIILLDPDNQKGVVVAASENQKIRDLQINLGDYPELRRLLETHEPVIIADTSTDELVSEVQQVLKARNIDAALLFPIIFEAEVVGALFLRSARPIPDIGARQASFGTAVAANLAVAIRNARLFDSFRDHTQRVNGLRLQAEKRMQVLEQYEDFFEYAADGMAVLDDQGRVQYLNREGHRILANDRDTSSTMLFQNFLTPASRQVLGNMQRVIRRGQYSRNIDLVANGLDGRERWLSVSASPLVEGQGFAVLSFRDVTELREIEIELKTTKDFLENLIDSSVDGIIAADLRGQVLLFNKGAEQIYGYNAHEVVGRIPVWKLYGSGVAVQIMAELRGSEMGGVGRVVQRRTEIQGKNGQVVPVSLTSSIIYEDGVEVATVGIFSDMRDRLRIEQELDDANHRLIETEKRAAVIELAGMAAHELNQPLTSVVGYAEMLRRKVKEGDPLRRHVDKIASEAERMAGIVRKLGKITKYKTKAYGAGTRIVDLEQATDKEKIPMTTPLVAQLSEAPTLPPRPAAVPSVDDLADFRHDNLEETSPGFRLSEFSEVEPDTGQERPQRESKTTRDV